MNPRENLVRIVLVVLLLYSMASLTSVGVQLGQSRQLLGTMNAQLEERQAVNAQLQAEIAQERDPEEMQQLARERLGLVLPGEKLFYFSSDREG
jgi:cell division protein FtsL